MKSLSCALTLMLALLGAWSAANAQGNRDTRFAERSALRIVIVQQLPDGSRRLLGTGSGFVVAPGKVLTNYHVAQDAVNWPDQVELLAIPAGSRTARRAQAEAYDSRHDLALLSVDTEGLPALALLAGSVEPGGAVTALGFPAAADVVALRLDSENFEPARVTVTGGRIVSLLGDVRQPGSYIFDGAIAHGSSGGPSVDACGRVVLINTLQSTTGGGDANFRGGASSLVMAAFLRANGVTPKTSAQPCVTMASFLAQEDSERRQRDEEIKAAEAASAQRAAEARRQSEDAARDAYQGAWNGAVLRLVLFGFAALAAGGGAVYLNRTGRAAWGVTAAASAAAVIALGWQLATLPALADFKAAAGDRPNADADTGAAPAALPIGEITCRMVPERSRIVTEPPGDLAFAWRPDGCIDNATQYSRDGTMMEAVVVKDDPGEAIHYVFDPVRREMRAARYFLLPDEVQSLLAASPVDPSCTRNPARRAEIDAAEARLKSLLPSEPNEVVAYRCSR